MWLAGEYQIREGRAANEKLPKPTGIQLDGTRVPQWLSQASGRIDGRNVQGNPQEVWTVE